MELKNAMPHEKHKRLMDRLEADRFYGVLETHFESGKIVRVKKHETLLEEDVDRLTKS